MKSAEEFLEHFAFEPGLQQLKVSEVFLNLFRASFFFQFGESSNPCTPVLLIEFEASKTAARGAA
jgi:hypothetical protein